MTKPQAPAQFADPATEAGELMIRIGVFLLAVALPFAAAFSRRSIFPLMPIGFVLILIGIALNPHRIVAAPSPALLLNPVALALVALVVWSGLAMLWTAWPAPAELRLAKTLGLFALIGVAWVVWPPRTRTANLYLLPIGAAVSAAAVLALALAQRFELLTGGVALVDSTLARASAGLAMLVWPAILALLARERGRLAAGLAALTAAAVIAVGSYYVIAALAIGGAAYAGARIRPRAGAVAFGAVFATFVVLGPALAIAAGTVSSSSSGGAAALADFVRGDGLRLITGHGYDSAAHVASGRIGFALVSSAFGIWYELGLPGALAAAVLAFGSFIFGGRAVNPIGPSCVGALATGWTLTLVAVSISQIWWLTTLGVTAFLFVMARRGRYRTSRPRAKLVTA